MMSRPFRPSDFEKVTEERKSTWLSATIDGYDYDMFKYEILDWCIDKFDTDTFTWSGSLTYWFKNEDDHTLFTLTWVR